MECQVAKKHDLEVVQCIQECTGAVVTEEFYIKKKSYANKNNCTEVYTMEKILPLVGRGKQDERTLEN